MPDTGYLIQGVLYKGRIQGVWCKVFGAGHMIQGETRMFEMGCMIQGVS